MGEISESFEYGLNAAATEYDGKHKYIRITDIDDSTHLFLQDDLTSPDIDFSTADDYLLQEGDVLFARTGASVGKPIFIAVLTVICILQASLSEQKSKAIMMRILCFRIL